MHVGKGPYRAVLSFDVFAEPLVDGLITVISVGKMLHGGVKAEGVIGYR